MAVTADLRGDAGEKFLPVNGSDQIIVHTHVERTQQPLVILRIDQNKHGGLTCRLD